MPQSNQGFTLDTYYNANTDIQAVAGVALGASAVVAYGSTPAAVNVPAVNAYVTGIVPISINDASFTNFGSPAVSALNTYVVNPVTVTGSVTVTGTVSVTQGTSPWVVGGNLTNNNAAPSSNNIGALIAVANAAAPTWTEGDQVLLSEDLSGRLRTLDDVSYWNHVALGSPSAWGTAPTGNVIGVNADLFAGGTGLTTTTAGSPAVASLNVFITGSEAASGGGYQYVNGTTPSPVYGTAALGIDVNGEVHVLNTDTYGNQEFTPAAPATSQFSFAVINVAVGAGSGNQTIIAGVGGKTVRIFEMDVQVSGLGASSSTITFKDGTSTALTGPYFALNGWSWSRDNNGDPAFTTTSGNGFVINNSTAAQLSGYVKYQQS